MPHRGERKSRSPQFFSPFTAAAPNPFCVKRDYRPTEFDKLRHKSTKADTNRQKRRPKLNFGCAGLETFAYRHNPTNNDKKRQKQTPIDKSRQKATATAKPRGKHLHFCLKLKFLGIFLDILGSEALTFSGFADALGGEIMPLSEIVRQAKTTTKGMLYGDKTVERRGNIVRKPNKILHKIMQFSAASLSLCDKTMRFAKNFAKGAAKKSVFAIA